MRYLVILVTSCMALLSSQIANAASFDIARPYVLQLIDGKPTEGKLVNARQLTLAAGKHQLVLQFEGSFRDQSETRLIRGEPIVYNLDLQSDDMLAMQFTYPRNYEEAEKFLQQQKIVVINKKTNQPVAVDSFVMPKKQGLQIGRDYQQELTEQGKAFQQISAPTVTATTAAAATAGTTVTAAAASTATTATVQPSATVQPAAQTLEMLKYWYLQADAKTRKDFQHWIISQQ